MGLVIKLVRCQSTTQLSPLTNRETARNDNSTLHGRLVRCIDNTAWFTCYTVYCGKQCYLERKITTSVIVSFSCNISAMHIAPSEPMSLSSKSTFSTAWFVCKTVTLQWYHYIGKFVLYGTRGNVEPIFVHCNKPLVHSDSSMKQ